MILARIVGPSGQIIAVEANSHNCRAAVRNRELNGLSQLQVICAAVADKPGTLIFNQMLNGQFDDGSGALGTTVVQAVTLDGLADQFGFPDVVFLDIEGAECLALSGAPRVLSSGADFVVEVHVGCGLEKLGGSVAEVLSYFPDDQFALLARAPEDDVYHRLQGQESMTRDHFFLIAQRRDYTSLLAG
jgi:FkbM family methyltransferase